LFSDDEKEKGPSGISVDKNWSLSRLGNNKDNNYNNMLSLRDHK